MAPNPQDLTTLEAVRRLLQTPEDSTVQDEMLQEMITEASVMLPRALGRRFVAESDTTKTFLYSGGGVVELVDDLLEATEVTFDAAGTPVELTSDRWQLGPVMGVSGLYRYLTLSDYSRTSATGQTVTITGDWGFPDIPADVERGVKITVKTWLREGAAFSTEGDLLRFERVGRIPQDVLDGLAHYRIPTIG